MEVVLCYSEAVLLCYSEVVLLCYSKAVLSYSEALLVVL